MRGGWGGRWVLPVLVTAFGGLLMAARPRWPAVVTAHETRVRPPAPDSIELKLSEVMVPEGSGDGAALLVDVEGRWTLPLFLGRSQAERLEQGAAGPDDAPARLLETALTQLGQRCAGVELDMVDGAPAGAILLGDGRRLDVLGGQLETAIGLAVRSEVPLRATRRLLETHGIEHGAGAPAPAIPTGLRPPRSL